MDRIIIIDKQHKITFSELKKLAKEGPFEELIKAVIDIRQELMAIGGSLHSDEEALLLQMGSKQQDLWGINLYPEETIENFIEFDSVINLRPSQGNFSRLVEDEKIRNLIKKIVNELIME